MDLPPPGVEPSSEWIAAYLALPLVDRLAVAVKIAERLKDETQAAFGTCATPDMSGKTVDERLAEGDAVAAELLSIAISLAPDSTLDHLDQNLGKDKSSAQQANALLSKLSKIQ